MATKNKVKLKFKNPTNAYGPDQHAVAMFKNGRGVSVISGLYTYGGKQGYYELAVLDADGDLDYTTPITNDVLGWLTLKEATAIARQVKGLPKATKGTSLNS